ncbi:hypothetical protein ACHAXT_004643 [Thalassiosira profunda]
MADPPGILPDALLPGLSAPLPGNACIRYSLHAIADAFEEGVAVGANSYKGKTYNKTFVGSAAVSWLVSVGIAKNREDAVRIGQMLVDKHGMFTSSPEGTRTFADRDVLYQFVPKRRRSLEDVTAHCIEETAQLFMEAVKPGSTFSGSSAVDTMIAHGLASSRSEAVLLAEKLATDLQLFHCVRDKRMAFFDKSDVIYEYSEAHLSSPASSLQWMGGEDTEDDLQEDNEETLEPSEEAEPTVACDKFGFILDGSDDDATVASRCETIAPIEEDLSINEWKAQIQSCAPTASGEWPSAVKDKAKALVRTGLPDSLRRHAWIVFTGVDRVVQEREGEYQSIVEEATRLMNRPRQRQMKGVIERDLMRTYPRHVLFRNTNDEDGRDTLPQEDELVPGGVASLRRLLYAYAIRDSEVGYCQGMNFCAGMMLTFMPEVEAFWLLVAIMDKTPWEMRNMFSEGMSGVHEALHVTERLMRKFLPKLYRHLANEHIDVSMFATQWFVTVYASTFRFDLVACVWDSFLVEGWKVVYRAMLALLQHAQKDLLELDMEGILTFMRDDLPANIDGPSIIRASLNIPLRQKHIQKYAKEWRAKQKNSNGTCQRIIADNTDESGNPPDKPTKNKALSFRGLRANVKGVKKKGLPRMRRKASF